MNKGPPASGYLLGANPKKRRLSKQEGDELLRSRHSVLANAPLVPKVLGWDVFKQLTPSEQTELAALLPECDRSPDMWEQVCGQQTMNSLAPEYIRAHNPSVSCAQLL